MCYPFDAYWEGACYESANRRRQLVAAAAAAAEAARRREMIGRGGGLAEGGGGISKGCVCSPTSHPGSFRCRQHHGEYQWVNRLGPKPS